MKNDINALIFKPIFLKLFISITALHICFAPAFGVNVVRDLVPSKSMSIDDFHRYVCAVVQEILCPIWQDEQIADEIKLHAQQAYDHLSLRLTDEEYKHLIELNHNIFDDVVFNRSLLHSVANVYWDFRVAVNNIKWAKERNLKYSDKDPRRRKTSRRQSEFCLTMEKIIFLLAHKNQFSIAISGREPCETEMVVIVVINENNTLDRCWRYEVENEPNLEPLLTFLARSNMNKIYFVTKNIDTFFPSRVKNPYYIFSSLERLTFEQVVGVFDLFKACVEHFPSEIIAWQVDCLLKKLAKYFSEEDTQIKELNLPLKDITNWEKLQRFLPKCAGLTTLTPNRFLQAINFLVRAHYEEIEKVVDLLPVLCDVQNFCGDKKKYTFINALLQKLQEIPLHDAASRGYANTVVWLLSNGADPNSQNAEGNTPLHLATRNPRAGEVVKLLLANGANPSLRNNVEVLAKDRPVTYHMRFFELLDKLPVSPRTYKDRVRNSDILVSIFTGRFVVPKMTSWPMSMPYIIPEIWFLISANLSDKDIIHVHFTCKEYYILLTGQILQNSPIAEVIANWREIDPKSLPQIMMWENLFTSATQI